MTLSHGNGLETGYSHNSSLKVEVGQKVERGQVIALSGTTGNSTGCHVHYEVIVDGKFQNLLAGYNDLRHHFVTEM
ncbi:M23 family metallopeptidase [Arthrobacter sp. JCM 19049]|uniref:M23 family metallopeptidase n=1 Tax=Arthrobacter sp. JCM 19049 TaxID=1460643 RepID=UPI0006D112CF|nr:M23 family metallopeptidase [Arthrobacter sp. JCM 19049]